MALRLLILLLFAPVLSISTGHSAEAGTGRISAPDAVQGISASRPESGKRDQEKIAEKTPENPKKMPDNLETQQQDKEYWCKRSVYYKKRIEQAQHEVDKEEEMLSELKDATPVETEKARKHIEKRIKQTRDRLADARQLLKDREINLIRLEEEARKLKIPSAWLQCQP